MPARKDSGIGCAGRVLRPHELTNVTRNPPRRFVLRETDYPTQKSRANFLFADGHVESRPGKEVTRKLFVCPPPQ